MGWAWRTRQGGWPEWIYENKKRIDGKIQTKYLNLNILSKSTSPNENTHKKTKSPKALISKKREKDGKKYQVEKKRENQQQTATATTNKKQTNNSNSSNSKQFDDNEIMCEIFVECTVLFTFYSALFMRFRISEIYLAIDQGSMGMSETKWKPNAERTSKQTNQRTRAKQHMKVSCEHHLQNIYLCEKQY